MKQETMNEKKLLVLDTSYSLEDIYKQGILKSVTCRDIDGYFAHVWTVHPFATLVTTKEWALTYGSPVYHKIDPAHSFIEGKIGKYKWLKFLPPVNFILSQIQLIFQLRRLIKKEGISIIRSGDILYMGLLGWVLSRICNIPYVVRVGGNHDKVFETIGKPIQKRLFKTRKIEKKVERFVLSRADLVVGANQDNLDFALENGARKEYSSIFRYGNLLHEGHFVDPGLREEGESLLKKLEVQPNKFLLYIGRLEKVKHPDHVLHVLSDLRNEDYNVKAVFVGRGTMLEELQLLAEKMQLTDDVVFAGNQNQDWISRVIPLAVVVLSPHTGRALSEAALGMVPVVAYDIDWQKEIIENEITGLIVKYPDLNKFSLAVKRILDEPSFARGLAHNLRNRALNMLLPKKLNEHEILQYEKLFQRHGH
ncbi:MAG: glycosyltransferase [Ferruginibacter sp.]